MRDPILWFVANGILAAALWGVVSLLVHRQKWGAATGLVGICILPSCIFVFLPLTLSCWLFMPTIVLAAARSWRPRTFSAVYGGLVLTCFGLFAYWGSVRAAEIKEVRELHPPQSLAARLAYETGYEDRASKRRAAEPQAAPSGATRSVAKDSPAVEGDDRAVSPPSVDSEESLPPWKVQQLEDYDPTPYRWGGRAYALKRYYEGTLLDFDLAMGFGVGRLGGRYRRDVELPDPGPIPQLCPLGSDEDSPVSPEELQIVLPRDPRKADPRMAAPVSTHNPGDWDSAVEPPDSDDLANTHRRGAMNFLDPDRWGYVRNRDWVAGFMPHAFGSLPRVDRRYSADSKERPNRWQVMRLELVSLLKHEQPMVYVSEHLPRMDELAAAPVRPLSEFERLALERLNETNLVILTRPQRILMLGAIRAGKSCQTCHAVERGTLLGAFSYDLRPDPANSENQTAQRPLRSPRAYPGDGSSYLLEE